MWNPRRSGSGGYGLACRILWSVTNTPPIRRVRVAALGPLREKTLFPGGLIVMHGQGIDVYTDGLHPKTAEGALVRACGNAREHAIPGAGEVGHPRGAVIRDDLGVPVHGQ